MLEFLHKYVAEVVSDATVYQEHAGKPEIDIDDLRLAIQVLFERGARCIHQECERRRRDSDACLLPPCRQK